MVFDHFLSLATCPMHRDHMSEKETHTQEPKKSINIKNLGRTPPPLLCKCPSLGRRPRSEGLRYWCRRSSALCACANCLLLLREEPFYLASTKQSTLEPW